MASLLTVSRKVNHLEMLKAMLLPLQTAYPRLAWPKVLQMEFLHSASLHWELPMAFQTVNLMDLPKAFLKVFLHLESPRTEFPRKASPRWVWRLVLLKVFQKASLLTA